MIKNISLMFSGGIDSTYCATKLVKDFDKIHLLNYSNGYGHFFLKKSKKRYLELKRVLGDKFVYSFSSVKPIFEKLLINDLPKDMDKYSSAFIWCLSCKLAMHSQSIIYNKLNKINFSTDGSSFDTSEMVEQTPLSISLIQNHYKKYGIEFEPVAYKVPRKDKIKKIKKLGIKTGISIMDRNIGIQPKCIPGELYYSPYLIMSRLPHHQSKEIYKFFREKKELLDSYINGEIKKI